MPRFTRTERHRARAVLRRFYKETNDREVLAERMNSTGITGPGGQPWTKRIVQNQLSQMGPKFKKFRKGSNRSDAAPVETPSRKPKNSDKDALFDLILDSDMGDMQKVNLIKALRR